MRSCRRKAICGVLETRVNIIPFDVMQEVNGIEEAQVLEKLLRKAVVVPGLPGFRHIMHAILTPA